MSDTNNETAEIIKDLQSKPQIPIKGNTTDFLKKFSKQSNLCSEIILPTDKERTAVCCLSSVNLEYYDDWKTN